MASVSSVRTSPSPVVVRSTFTSVPSTTTSVSTRSASPRACASSCASVGSPERSSEKLLRTRPKRVPGAVAHGAHRAAVEVGEDQALEQVVHVGGGDAELDVLVADDGAGVLEVADAGREEHDAGHGEVGDRDLPLGRRERRREDEELEDQRCGGSRGLGSCADAKADG